MYVRVCVCLCVCVIMMVYTKNEKDLFKNESFRIFTLVAL